GDITQGLPRVEEVFEKRTPKNPAVVAHISGVVSEIRDEGKERVLILLPELEDRTKSKKLSDTQYSFHYLRVPLVKVGDKVNKGDIITDGSADIDELFKFAGRE